MASSRIKKRKLNAKISKKNLDTCSFLTSRHKDTLKDEGVTILWRCSMFTYNIDFSEVVAQWMPRNHCPFFSLNVQLPENGPSWNLYK